MYKYKALILFVLIVFSCIMSNTVISEEGIYYTTSGTLDGVNYTINNSVNLRVAGPWSGVKVSFQHYGAYYRNEWWLCGTTSLTDYCADADDRFVYYMKLSDLTYAGNHSWDDRINLTVLDSNLSGDRIGGCIWNNTKTDELWCIISSQADDDVHVRKYNETTELWDDREKIIEDSHHGGGNVY